MTERLTLNYLKRRYNFTEERARLALEQRKKPCPKCGRGTKAWNWLDSERIFVCNSCAVSRRAIVKAEIVRESGRKTCFVCKLEKSVLEFPKDKTRPSGYAYLCKICCNLRSQNKYHSDPEKSRLESRLKHKRYREQDPNLNRKNNLKRRYTLTFEQYNEMFDAQDRTCAVCKTTESGAAGWAVDHDHDCCDTYKRTCGKCVRGILCQDCNQGLGRFKDNPHTMLAGIKYLAKYKYIKERVNVTRGAIVDSDKISNGS